MNQRRQLHLETLEARNLLAADVGFQNPLEYQDVNFDDHVSSVDALYVINHLNDGQQLESESIGAFLDVDGDTSVSPIDALQIFNELNGVEEENAAIFEQVDELTSEMQLMSGLMPEDLEALAGDVLGVVESREEALSSIKGDLKDFLLMQRSEVDLISQKRKQIMDRASSLADDLIRDFNRLNDDHPEEFIGGKNLHKLGIYNRFKDSFQETRQRMRGEYKWEDYLPAEADSDVDSGEYVAKLRKAVSQGIVPEHITPRKINRAIRSLTDYGVFDFRFGDGKFHRNEGDSLNLVDVSGSYSGYLADGDYSTVESRHDFIVDNRALEELWQEWALSEEMPQVDFESQMVVVATVVGPNEIMMQPTIDDTGNLMLKAASTRVWGSGFSYEIQVVSRQGVTSVNHVDINREGGTPSTEEIASQRIQRLRQWKDEGNLPDFISEDLADDVLSQLEDGRSPLGRLFRRLSFGT